MDNLSAYSKLQIEQGSKSFALAARLFEPRVRADAYLLYTWCRHCDDLIDGQHLGYGGGPPQDQGTMLARVLELEQKTRAALAGDADEPAFQCLNAVCTRHAMPVRYPLELIAGFRMDAERRRYHTIGDTLEYSYHVAGVVGVMMSIIMGAREPDTLNRAADLGIAFQLTNIARDVVADYRSGRVYLPADWLHDAAIEPDALNAAENRQSLFDVTERLLETADIYYASARLGFAQLPWRSRWAVASAHRIYAGIGEGVRRRGVAAWDTRVSTTRLMKMRCILRGAIEVLGSRGMRGRADCQRREGLWTMRQS